MALTITKSDEVISVEQLCCTIYSQPGLGKTSLAFTAATPLLLDFDKGAHRAVDRKDTVQVESWADVADIGRDDVKGYETIIIDTVGKALESLSQDILNSNPRLGYGGALNKQGWGQLGVRFGAFLRRLKGFGKDVVLIAHMDEQRDGDAIKERLKIPGGSKDLVLTDSDLIGRISIYNKQRQLIFSPTEASFGKDPVGLGSVQIPDSAKDEFSGMLEGILAEAKSKMTNLSEAALERKGEIEWFRQALPEVKDADGINDLLGRAKKAGRDASMMLVDRAKDLGLEFDGGERRYVYLEEMAADGKAA